jgi:N6-adenosine-specific RNA methylase IME4
MDLIEFNYLQDKGYVFIWVTNLMDVVAIDFMRERNYEKIETINWSKLEPSGKHYKRSGGATLLHCNE